MVAVLVVWALCHAAAGVVSAEEAREDWAGDDAGGSVGGDIAVESGDLGAVGRVDEPVADRNACSCDIVRKAEPGAVVRTRRQALPRDIVSEVKIGGGGTEQRNDASSSEDIGVGRHPRAIVASAPQCAEMGLPVGKGVGCDASSDAPLREVIAVAIQ